MEKNNILTQRVFYGDKCIYEKKNFQHKKIYEVLIRQRRYGLEMMRPTVTVVVCGDDGRVHQPILHQHTCLLYTSPSPRDGLLSRMPSSA